jgi:hypothetical protein
VASDALGQAYIIPLHATLKDIQKKTQAGAVTVPTGFDNYNYGPAAKLELNPSIASSRRDISPETSQTPSRASSKFNLTGKHLSLERN